MHLDINMLTNTTKNELSVHYNVQHNDKRHARIYMSRKSLKIHINQFLTY